MKQQLSCSCCGVWFMGEQDESNDKSYGTCAKCEEWIEERFAKPRWKAMERMVANALNETNREKFLDSPEHIRRGFIQKLMDEGGITLIMGRADY